MLFVDGADCVGVSELDDGPPPEKEGERDGNWDNVGRRVGRNEIARDGEEVRETDWDGCGDI
jgi:hypothetical protein